ncbi:MAG TPA: glycine zipper domain-containing protein [Chitinophagaceae bacterium]|nr:glycine zipper domain-containing protein [Chitinophagaceae bacterium]
MARSHHRHKKYHPQKHHPTATSKARRRGGTIVFIIFLGIFGLGIGYFASGTITAVVIGAVIGGFIGYVIGHNLDNLARKK